MADLPPVIVVTGRTRPGECGVSDYSAELVQILRDRGISVRRAELERLGDLAPFMRGLERGAIVHLQYPVVAWRTSPLPIVLAVWLRLRGCQYVTSTIHEFSRAHWARRLMCALLARLSSLVVVTSDYESSRLRHWLRAGQHVAVLPIASNIASESEQSTGAQRRGIVHFGLLAPDKGLEAFFDVVQPWLTADSTVPVTVAGSVVRNHEPWLQSLRDRHPRTRFLQSLSSSEVSDVLRGASIALLPYPDGISERRGSALAALAHGMQVVTTRGPATTDELASVCHLVSGPEEARTVTARLLADDSAWIDHVAVQRYNFSRSWPAIAERQVDLYRALTGGEGSMRWN